MIDLLHLSFTIATEAAEEEFLRSKAMQWAEQSVEKGWYQVVYRGLRIRYSPTKRRGWIKGSLHSFALGHNQGKFLPEAVSDACRELCLDLTIPAAFLAIEVLEIGVNIFTPDSPNRFLDELRQHKKAVFYYAEIPKGCTRPLLRTAAHTDYRVKLYNKAAYVRSQKQQVIGPPNSLRFEVRFNRSRALARVLGYEGPTLGDLMEAQTLQSLAAYLRKVWYEIERAEPVNLEGLTLRERLLRVGGEHPEVWSTKGLKTSTKTRRAVQKEFQRLKAADRELFGVHSYEPLFIETLDELTPSGPIYRVEEN